MTLPLACTAVGIVMGFVMLARLRVPHGSGVDRRVSVIIPARNEAASLPILLDSLASQTLPAFEVLVVDDASTDGTAAAAHARGATVIGAPPLPEGWVGKSWACHQGSLRARGDVFVFLDADVTVAPDGLERIVASWERAVPEGLFSVQPFHETARPYEQLSAYPNLVSMMASGAFGPGGSHWSPVAFGPCLVTSADAYRAVGGHEAVRSEVIEDVCLARAYGDAGRPVRTRAGGSAVSFRMYPAGAQQLIDGWTKNIAGGPRLVSLLPMAATVAWITASIVVASGLVRSFTGSDVLGPAPWAPLAAWALTAAQLTVLLRRIGRFAWWAGPAFPLLLAAFVAVFLRSTIHRMVRRQVTWHDRSVAVRVR